VPGKENRVYRAPVGVVAVISPWTFPLALSSRSVAPALAPGNAVVLKPAEDTPVTGGLFIAKVFEEAGLPPGVLQVLTHSRYDAAVIGVIALVLPAHAEPDRPPASEITS
jgi:aldehyde dehydrogenase (NAD+)